MRTEIKTGFCITGEASNKGKKIYHTSLEFAKQAALEKGLDPVITETQFEMDIYESREEIRKAKKDGTYVDGRIIAIQG